MLVTACFMLLTLLHCFHVSSLACFLVDPFSAILPNSYFRPPVVVVLGCSRLGFVLLLGFLVVSAMFCFVLLWLCGFPYLINVSKLI